LEGEGGWVFWRGWVCGMKGRARVGNLEGGGGGKVKKG